MKKATSMDVAKLAGVSQTTVSLILSDSKKSTFSEETRRKVYDAVRQLNYQPTVRKKTIRNDASHVLLVLVPTLTNQYYSDLVSYVEDYAASLNYQVMVCNTFRKPALEKFYLTTFAGNTASGILYTFFPGYPRLAEEMDETIPTVVIGEKQEDLKLCSIELSNERAGELLAQHLIELGHRKFAFISTPLNQLSMARTQRLEGIRKQLEAASYQDCLSVLTPESETDREDGLPYEYSLGRKLTARLLAEESDATALIGVNDMTAIGILNELSSQGYKVPRDFSVCGFDNIFSAHTTTPELTTIDHHMKVRCETAVDMIISRLMPTNVEKPYAHKIEYTPQLVARGSTGPVSSRRVKKASCETGMEQLV